MNVNPKNAVGALCKKIHLPDFVSSNRAGEQRVVRQVALTRCSAATLTLAFLPPTGVSYTLLSIGPVMFPGAHKPCCGC